MQLADGLAWLAQDPETDVIMAYLEGCRDGPRLRAALALAQQHGKPVVMVKVGASALGAAAAASHTASLAGDDAVYDAVFRRYGVLRVHGISDFFALAASASIARAPKGRSIGLLTVSGGVGALMADDASAAGLRVPPLSAAAQRQLRDWVPFAGPRNPVDITAQVTNDATLLERSATLMLRRPAVPTAGWASSRRRACRPRCGPRSDDLVKTLRAQHPDTLLAVSTLCPDERRAGTGGPGLPGVFRPGHRHPLHRRAGALGRVSARRRTRRRSCAAPACACRPAPCRKRTAWRCWRRPGCRWSRIGWCARRTRRRRPLDALGGAIALKVASADIAHKSDVGGVALHLRDADEAARAAFEQIMHNARQARPDAHIDGALAARMVERRRRMHRRRAPRSGVRPGADVRPGRHPRRGAARRVAAPAADHARRRPRHGARAARLCHPRRCARPSTG
ncbi:hypothetical protein MASR1M50_21130 [Burkholderiales bacterium]